MKTILTVAMVLSLVMTSAYAHTPAEHSSENVTAEPDEKNIEICTQNLIAIGGGNPSLPERTRRFTRMALRSSSETFGRCEYLGLSGGQSGVGKQLPPRM